MIGTPLSRIGSWMHALRLGLLQKDNIGVGVATDHTQLAAVIPRNSRISISSGRPARRCLSPQIRKKQIASECPMNAFPCSARHFPSRILGCFEWKASFSTPTPVHNNYFRTAVIRPQSAARDGVSCSADFANPVPKVLISHPSLSYAWSRK